jgi:DnaJ-domain-containing protein 1
MSEELRKRREAREAERLRRSKAAAAGEDPSSADLLTSYGTHIKAMFAATATVFIAMRYSWGFVELERLDAKALLREPVPELLQMADHSNVGNGDCFDEEYTYGRCCDLSIGPVGDRKCWRGDIGYTDCCHAQDKVAKARFIMQRGEKYFQSARWLVNAGAKRRHFKDALSAFKLAKQFDDLGEELQWMISNTEGALRAQDPPPPPPPPRNAPKTNKRGGSAPVEELPTRPPHEVLGVERDASPAEIKAAYRKLSRQLHPDRHGGDENMEQRFMEVTRAHELMTAVDGFSE